MDEAAKIAVSVEVQLAELQAGLAAAQAQIAAMAERTGTAQERAAQRAARAQEREAARAARAVEREAARAQAAIEKEADAAGRRIAASQAAVFGANSKTSSDIERFARRANIMLGVQAFSGALAAASAVGEAYKGNFDDAYAALEQLPLGLGEVARRVREIGMELSGANDYIREMQALSDQMAEQNAGIAATAGARSANAALEAQIAADAATDPEQRARIQIEEARRKAREERRALVNAGVDPAVAARNAELRVQAELQRIEKERLDAIRQRQREELEGARAVHREEIERARETERVQREVAEKERRAKMDAIESQIDQARELGDMLNDQLAEAQAITGANFISTISTGLGSFRVGQSGGAEAVGRAQIRSAELLAKINDNIKSLKDLAAERDFVSSLR